MRKKIVALGMAAILATGLLTGCSAGGKNSSSVAASGSEASGSTVAASGSKVSGSTVAGSSTTASSGKTAASGKSTSGDRISLKFGYAPPNVTEVFKSAENYLIKAAATAKDYGIDIDVVCAEPTGGETNYESQVTNLENLLAQHCDAIFCSPGSIDACHNVFEEINKAGVPLILFNIVEPPEGIDAYIVGFNNEVAGAVSGYAFLDYYGGPGVLGTGEKVSVDKSTKLTLDWWKDLYKDFDYSKISPVNVGIISGIEGSIFTNQRYDGFNSVVSKASNVKIVSTLNGDWDRDTSMKAAENILQSHKDLNAFFAMCAESEMACTVAVENAGVADKIPVFGNDGTKESLKAISDKKIVAETWHGFPEWGWYGVETAAKLCLGLKCDKFIDIGPRTEYADNIDLFIDPKFNPIDWQGIRKEAGK